MSEALERVKADLGRDAIILHTRSFTSGGVFGVGAKPVVEITATRDAHVGAAVGGGERRPAAGARDGGISRSVVDARTLRGAPESARSGVGGRAPGAVGNLNASAAYGGAVARLNANAAGRSTVAALQSAAQIDTGLREEVDEIRAMVAQLLRETRGQQTPTLPAELVDYYSGLIGQAVSSELARQMVERIAGKLGLSATGANVGAGESTGSGSAKRTILRPTDERVRAELQTCLGEMLPPAAPIELTARNRPTVVALVGPTGVGKTTTVAKLAAAMKLREGRRVGLITIDTYRIAAVEQLRTYAQILDVPLISVMTPGEMKSAIGRMADRDLILIDTAGRSQRDDPRIDELRKFLAGAEPDQVHLVLSTTAREEAMREAVERFAAVGARHVVFTKLDEAVGLGVMLNVLNNAQMRLSYITNGQAVPDDIETGSAQRVAELIVAGLTVKPKPPVESGWRSRFGLGGGKS